MDDNSHNSASLYTRSVCMVCMGRQYTCPYCDGEGKNYIEASDNYIVKWFGSLNKDRRTAMIEEIRKGEKKDGRTGR